jgi:mRNA interferase MazF
MVSVNRGDVVWADFGEPRGSGPAYRRPAVIVQSNRYTSSAIATVVIAVLTSNTALGRYRDNVFLPNGTANLNKDSIVNVTQIYTIDKSLIDRPIGQLPNFMMDQVDSGIRSVLGL